MEKFRNMQVEKLLIKNRDGYELHAVYYQKSSESKSDVLVILCHGFTGDKYEWGRFEKTSEKIIERGWDAIFFDFSGSGENERIPITLDNQIRDLEDIAQWGLQQGYSKLVTIGLSFGGITSLYANVPNRKVAVFWAPAFNMKRVIGEKMKRLAYLILSIKKSPIKMRAKVKPIMMDKSFFESIWNKDPWSLLQNFDLPSIIVQGTKDKAVIPSDSQMAFDHMKKDGKHELHFVEGATHDFEKAHLDEFIKVSLDFIEKYL
jgi:pimeloyl-ACP methyl ester carboxylesterase